MAAPTLGEGATGPRRAGELPTVAFDVPQRPAFRANMLCSLSPGSHAHLACHPGSWPEMPCSPLTGGGGAQLHGAQGSPQMRWGLTPVSCSLLVAVEL